jgi:hypothetical protein
MMLYEESVGRSCSRLVPAESDGSSRPSGQEQTWQAAEFLLISAACRLVSVSRRPSP